MPRKPTDPFERFWPKVAVEGDCIVWMAATNNIGYPVFWMIDHQVYAHRWIYEQCVGRIPDDFEVDHLCRNKRCVAPDHLEAVPQQVNNMRSRSKSAVFARATHCVNGHPFDTANTYMRRTGGRMCRECMKLRMRRYRSAS